jgi:hypothetical protein|tara:strand:- start:44 stop:178 length:135 start_codon:yes stop_codon:yes gene_type:complete
VIYPCLANDLEKDKNMKLTAKQKKLPMALQKAIMKKKKKTKRKK